MSRLGARVTIVGGGPCGLFLGCLLAQRGIDFVIYEQRSEPSTHSRSIGIHPPSLEALDTIGVADALIEAGVKIESGVVYMGRRAMGVLSFERCPPPHNYVLALPQAETERILEERLHELAPGALKRGVPFEPARRDGAGSSDESHAESAPDAEKPWIVGCDGRDSTVRTWAGIAIEGDIYRDRYAMGDFADPDGPPGPRQGGIWLTSDGLVESFPLPAGKRRWVVKLPPDRFTDFDNDNPLYRADPARICDLIKQRTGHRPDPESCTMTSTFGIERRLATRMALARGPGARSRILLVGDAAHVVSPIGGQGMNLGWMDAVAAADVTCRNNSLRNYDRHRRTVARKVARRAAFNTWMGRAGAHRWKARGAALVLKTPAASFFARRFTMRGL